MVGLLSEQLGDGRAPELKAFLSLSVLQTVEGNWRQGVSWTDQVDDWQCSASGTGTLIVPSGTLGALISIVLNFWLGSGNCRVRI